MRDPWVATRPDADARVAAISEARHLASIDAALPLGAIDDIAPSIERVRKSAALDAPELISVAGTARSLARLRTHLRSRAEIAPRLAAMGEPIADLGHVFHPILEAFDSDGRLVDHASEALGPLRRAFAAIQTQLERRMKTLLEDDRFAPYLQDGFYTQREDRYVLPIRMDGKGFVRGIVHGTSQSGQTMFIEPDEIVELNNRLKLAECDVQDEERRIMVRFSTWIAEEADAFTASLDAAEAIDVIGSAAVLAGDLVAAAPIIDATAKVHLLHARHPLMLLSGRRCVANDVVVAAGQTLLVSGPNAGGKTVALKATGLAALMVRAGLHIAAESGSIMGWFDDVRTDIGDAQNLEQNLSTFTGHVKNLTEFLAAAAPGVLILIDEIAVGTDPEQGAALAQAMLEALADKHVTAIVTTHYERLKTLGATTSSFANASVGFDMARLEPTFKLHLGLPGSSGAFAVARRTGLASSVVDRATALLGAGGARVDDLLANVTEQRRRLEEERAAVLAELETHEADRQAMRVARERNLARFEKQTRAAHGEALATLKAARRELDGVREHIRRKADAATIDDVKAANKRIMVVAGDVARNEPKRALPPGRTPKPEELVIGAPVVVPSLGGRAVIASLPDGKGKVGVRLGSMHALVDVSEVLLDSHRAAQARAKVNAPLPEAAPAPAVVLMDGQTDGRVVARTVDTTIDVRGQRADEAIIGLDRFLDEGMMSSRDVLFVIHGHGTGALRTAVRTHLARHAAVKRWRAGEKTEGGDGVTVLWLRD